MGDADYELMDDMHTIKLPTGTFDYDPTQPLGKRGGFGQVFAGKSADGSDVAVKKLHLSAAEAAHRELRIANELKGRSFEHVVPFIDAGQDADSDDYFVVMPKAEGSLQVRIDKNGVFAADVAAAILFQIAKGLLEVGELVHRDLKPDNVLFHEGKWKIADFGIAKFVADATSSNTLKGCLSPLYAAPEQWQNGTITQATDVYSLGCVAFCLLTGKPPFVTNPSEEHERAAVPPFNCSDARLHGLVNMMLRKNSTTRPSVSRVRDLLGQLVSNPNTPGKLGSLDALAKAAATAASKEQQEQAREQAIWAAQHARHQLMADALKILSKNIERLWTTIHTQIPNAERLNSGGNADFLCQIGKARLGVSARHARCVEPGSFPQSGWDVVTFAVIEVGQPNPNYTWSSSLWFMKPKEASEYRWYEVSYFSRWGQSVDPHALPVGSDADFAGSRVMHTVSIAFGPSLVDDEAEGDFHDRWIWLLSKAVTGELRTPSRMPFDWPPHLV